MKVLITKADGTPTKSKVHAYQFLEKKGLTKDCLIEENGQFFYEDEECFATQELKTEAYAEAPKVEPKKENQTSFNKITWETPVFDEQNEKTKLIIPGSNVTATINAKHPAGQIKPKSSFELCIEGENVILSLELVSKIFMVRG